MALASGTRVGPYEILAPLGAGGMGEVYRARDTRLGRDVAIKVLRPAAAGDPKRLHRFEQEVRAAGQLNHPNILAIFDVGTHEGVPFLVSELLEGQTLRERLKDGGLGPRRAVEFAAQIAQGLGLAHSKRIVHRDLKPGNLFLTQDGRIKILDFGLARLMHHDPEDGGPDAVTQTSSETLPGTMLGTVGYMSPEQVRGEPADHRSDIFNLGLVLYEMLTGQQAFQGATTVETLTATLKDEPPHLAAAGAKSHPALPSILRRCLEKDRERRFHSARDLAFALEALSGASGPVPAIPVDRPRRTWPLFATVATLLAVLGGSYWLGHRDTRTSQPVYHPLTFGRGWMQTAAFAPDGQTIVYGAAWNGRPVELFSTRAESGESRSLGLPGAEILSISSTGEMLLFLNRSAQAYPSIGTLARCPLTGGSPREIAENVTGADWSPDGSEIAASLSRQGRSRIEYPLGKVLYETDGRIILPHVSPNGKTVAFFEYRGDLGGVSVMTVDTAGQKKELVSRWLFAWGLAWASSNEIWFTGSEKGPNVELYGVTGEGRRRLIQSFPGFMGLRGISRDGRALLIRHEFRGEIVGRAPHAAQEYDLSWLGGSQAMDLSADGKTLLFSDLGQGGFTAYLRQTDGSPAVRLETGRPQALSPDGRLAIVLQSAPASRLLMVPTRAGQNRQLAPGGIQTYLSATWLPDGRRILSTATEAGRAPRLYLQDLDGPPRAISEEGVTFPAGTHPVSPDGRWVAALNSEGKVALYPLEGEPARTVPGTSAQDLPVGWTPDGRSLVVLGQGQLPTPVYRVDVQTGRRETWKEISPPDPAGVYGGMINIQFSSDAKAYVYSYTRLRAQLFLVDGLR